jgi:integrase
LAERDRLVLLALVTTALRRSELIALDWCDLELDGPRPSLLVRCGKDGKPRRQALAPAMARELIALPTRSAPGLGEPVFRGLAGGRLQPAILAAIIRRCAQRAQLGKRVTAHTLRTPQRHGYATPPATHASSPSTWATPTSPRSIATPTWQATSCMPPPPRSPPEPALTEAGLQPVRRRC